LLFETNYIAVRSEITCSKVKEWANKTSRKGLRIVDKH
jgi:hypothetical protein